MIFIEPEVDCFCLRLRDVRVPASVLALQPDTLAAVVPPLASTLPASHRGSARAEFGDRHAADAHGGSRDGERDSGRRSPSAACTVSSSSERTTASGSFASGVPRGGSSGCNLNSGVGCRGTNEAAPHRDTGCVDGPSYAKVSLEERADAVHRALLSTLHARFPYEAPDSLEYAYVLVVTHHATMSLLRPDWTAAQTGGDARGHDLELLHRLTCEGDFQPTELRCRTFPSHLNVLLDPTSAAVAAAAEEGQQEQHQQQLYPSATPRPDAREAGGAAGRSSIRVTAGSETDAAAATAATTTAASTATTAAAASPLPLHNTPTSPRVSGLTALPSARFYDSFFLLARALTPEQQALYYASQRLGRPIRVDAATAAARMAPSDAGAAASAMTAFSVLEGRFLHHVPTEASDATGRIEDGDGGLRRVAGESRPHHIGDRPRETTDAASAAEARALYFSVYRIPLTRFSPTEQQYCTRQREELRWRQRHRCRASYRARRRDGGGVNGEQPPQQQWLRSQRNPNDPVSTDSPQSRSAVAGGSWRDALDLSSPTSSSSGDDEGSCSDDSDADEGCANVPAGGAHRSTTGCRGTTASWRARTMWSAMDGLFASEITTAAPTEAPPATSTAEQRHAACFFRTCHEVLTNYAVAHSPYAALLRARPSGARGGSSGAPADEGAGCVAQRQRFLRRYPGVSYVGVTRLLYSLAPCDCYHLVMKDSNPLYYAHSSRAAYEPQTVPLSLVSDLSPETAGSPPSGAKQEPPRHCHMPGGGGRVLLLTHLKAASTPAAATRYTGVDEAAGAAAQGAAGASRETELRRTTASAPTRPSPTPPLSGRVLLLGRTAPPPPASGGPEALVRTPCVSRAPSPDRATRTSARHQAAATAAGARASAAHGHDGLVSATDGFLRVTTSLLCNNVSGNPKTSVKSLAEKGVQVPSFLLPDGTHSSRSTRTAAGRAGTDTSAAPAAAAAAAVNLFKALAQSSLAQRKLRDGSLRAVISVAVLDTAPSHASTDVCADGADDGGDAGFAAGVTDLDTGDGTRRFGTSEATALRLSRRHVCRGLVDHTWLSIPVQHVPAEQEAIQWMPVMLGSTECVSDVGLRTAVHIGIFPATLPKANAMPSSAAGATAGAGSGPATAPTAHVYGGAYPTREGAMNSLQPSQANWQRRSGPHSGSSRSTVSASTESATSTRRKPRSAAEATAAAAPLRARDVNSGADSTAPSTPPPPQPCKENAAQTRLASERPASQPPPQPPTTVTPARSSRHSAADDAEAQHAQPEAASEICTATRSAAAPYRTAATTSPPPVTRRSSPHRVGTSSRYTTGTTRLSAATSGWEELSLPATAPESDAEGDEEEGVQAGVVDVEVDEDIDLVDDHDGAHGEEEHDYVERRSGLNAAATPLRIARGSLARAADGVDGQHRRGDACLPAPHTAANSRPALSVKAPFARLAAAHPATVTARTSLSEGAVDGARLRDSTSRWCSGGTGAEGVDAADAFEADADEERTGGTRDASRNVAAAAHFVTPTPQLGLPPRRMACWPPDGNELARALAGATESRTDALWGPRGGERDGSVRRSASEAGGGGGGGSSKSIQWATELRRSTPLLLHDDETLAAPRSITARDRDARHSLATPIMAAASRYVRAASGAGAWDEEEEGMEAHAYFQPTRGRGTASLLSVTSSATPFGATRRATLAEGLRSTPMPVLPSASASAPLRRRDEAAATSISQPYDVPPANTISTGGSSPSVGRGAARNPFLARPSTAVAASTGAALGLGVARQQQPLLHRYTTPPRPFPVPLSAGVTEWAAARDDPRATTTTTTATEPSHPHPFYGSRPAIGGAAAADTALGAMRHPLASLSTPHSEDGHHALRPPQQPQSRYTALCPPFGQPANAPLENHAFCATAATSRVPPQTLSRLPTTREPHATTPSVSNASATPLAHVSLSSSPWLPERFFDDDDAPMRSGATVHAARPTHDYGRGASTVPPLHPGAATCDSRHDPRAGASAFTSHPASRQTRPEVYFGLAWNARKTQQDPLASQTTPPPHGPSSHETRDVRSTLFLGNGASPSPRHAMQSSHAPPEPESKMAGCSGAHQPRPSFFSPPAASRLPLTSATARDFTSAAPHTPPAATTRQTIGTGRLSFSTPPPAPLRGAGGASAGIGDAEWESRFAAAPAAVNLHRDLFIDEFDDTAVAVGGGGGRGTGGLRGRATDGWACGGAEAGGAGSRVRPRGVSAMDPAWWRPAPELSAAPNVRLTSFHDYDCPPARRALPPRASTDQPYAPPLQHANGDRGGGGGAAAPRWGARFFGTDVDDHGVHGWGSTAHPADRTTPLLPSLQQPCGAEPAWTRLSSSLWRRRPSADAGAFAAYDERGGVSATAEVSPSPIVSHRLQARPPFVMRRARDSVNVRPSTTSWAVPIHRRPPLAPPYPGATETHGDACAGSTLRAADRANPAAAPVPRSTAVLSHTYLSVAERVRQRRQELERRERLAQYREHLQENYLCGAAPKRFCYEQAPGSGETERAGGTAPAAWPSQRTTCVPPLPVASLATTPVWRIGEEARNRSLGLQPPPPALPSASASAPSTAVPVAPGAAATHTQAAEDQLRKRAERDARMAVRRQMEEVADGAGGTAAARLVTASNVSFTLRDVAAAFLRLPSTSTAHRRGGAGAGVAGRGGLEVLDVCHAVRRTEGASCFLSRKPARLRGGWASYLERINLYQEPFYLSDQAFVLTLPVPHDPSLKVCVAIPNVNDLLALVCQTPVPRLLPTAEEVWMQQCQYGLYEDDAGDDERSSGDGRGVDSRDAPAARRKASDGAAVVEEERRWFFGLVTTRRLVPAPPSSAGHGAAVGRSSRDGRGGSRGSSGVADGGARSLPRHRQHQLDGLHFTWRHRARLWYALLRAGWTCAELPACTSPYLTDPEACKARCALVCDRLAAYAGLRHRVETLRLVRDVYLESRATELARQRVLKLCDRSERGGPSSCGDGGGGFRLGGGGTAPGGGAPRGVPPLSPPHCGTLWDAGWGAATRFGTTADATAESRAAARPFPAAPASAWWSSLEPTHDDALAARGGVAFSLDTARSHGSAAWAAPRADAATRGPAARHGSLRHAEEWEGEGEAELHRRQARAGTPRPPPSTTFGSTFASHAAGDAPAASLRHRFDGRDGYVHLDDNFDDDDDVSRGLRHRAFTRGDALRGVRALDELPLYRRSAGTPPPPPSVSATAARWRGDLYVDGDACDDAPAWRTTNTRTNATATTASLSGARDAGTQPSAWAAQRPDPADHPYATGPTPSTSGMVAAAWRRALPSLGRPAAGTAAAGLAPAQPQPLPSTIAPYASESAIAPLFRTPVAAVGGGGAAPSSFAIRAAAASIGMDVLLRIERDDGMAAALQRLAEPRAIVLTTPLQPVLSVVPLASQPVRGAGAGVGGADALVKGTGGGGAGRMSDDPAADAAAPVYAGFVPTPLEVQQRAAQPFNLSIAQAQQLLQWQWEFHQHRYTLMPVPLLIHCGSSAQGGGGAMTATPPVDFTHLTPFSSPVFAPSSAPASAFAVSPLARELVLHLLRWSWLLPIDYAASRQSRRHRLAVRSGLAARAVRTLSQSLHPWRGLLWLLVLALAVEHAWWCLRALLALGILHGVGNVLGVGLAVRLPSHRGGVALWSRAARWLKWLVVTVRDRRGDAKHRRRHHASPHHRRTDAHALPHPLCFFEKDLPPLDQGISLVYSLGEATTQAVLERRQATVVSQAVLVRVLRLQTAGAALLSRLQLFILGYSTALSVWVLLLLLAYTGLYVGYVDGLHAVARARGCGVGSSGIDCDERSRECNARSSAWGWPSDCGASRAGSWLWGRVTGHTVTSGSPAALSRGETASSAASPPASAAERSAALLQGLSTAAWHELLEPTRFLLAQRLRAVLGDYPRDAARDEDAHEEQGERDAGDAVTAAAEAMASVVQAELLRNGASATAAAAAPMAQATRNVEPSRRRGPASPSYFYQNGRYYAYDAAPPAWAQPSTAQAESSSADADVPVDPSASTEPPPDTARRTPTGTHVPTPAAPAPPPPSQSSSTSTPSSTPSAPSAFSRVAKAWGALRGRTAGAEETARPAASAAERASASPSAPGATAVESVAPEPAAATASRGRESGNATGVERVCVAPTGAAPPPLPASEPGLLWFVVLAYGVTFCLPRSPFRWLWRRVWAVLLHDDALTRRPTLTV